MELETYQMFTDMGAKPEQAKLAVGAIHREIEKQASLKAAEYVKRVELTDFATKSDIYAVKSDLYAVKNELYAAIEKLKTTMIQWFLGSSISIAAVVIAVIKLWH